MIQFTINMHSLRIHVYIWQLGTHLATDNEEFFIKSTTQQPGVIRTTTRVQIM